MRVKKCHEPVCVPPSESSEVEILESHAIVEPLPSPSHEVGGQREHKCKSSAEHEKCANKKRVVDDEDGPVAKVVKHGKMKAQTSMVHGRHHARKIVTKEFVLSSNDYGDPSLPFFIGVASYVLLFFQKICLLLLTQRLIPIVVTLARRLSPSDGTPCKLHFCILSCFAF